MPRTALDLITASLKRLNVLAGTETPSADLAEDALARLNDLLETWTTEELSLYALSTIGRELLFVPPPPNAAWYTIGPGGNVDVAQRPPWLESVSFILPGSNPLLSEYKLRAFTQREWEFEQQKLLYSSQPTHYYYSPQWPHGQLFLWPQVQSGTFNLWIYVPIPIGPIATLTTEIDWPQGYFRALRDNLAMELAPELGRVVDPALAHAAQDALAQLKRANFRPRVLGLDPALPCARGHYDWRTDEYH